MRSRRYGKGALIGLGGELEHGALWHVPGGYGMRDLLAGSHAIVPSTTKIGAAGSAIDVPIHHRVAAYVRSHFDSIEVRVADAPRPDEMLLVIAMTTGAAAARARRRTAGRRDCEVRRPALGSIERPESRRRHGRCMERPVQRHGGRHERDATQGLRSRRRRRRLARARRRRGSRFAAATIKPDAKSALLVIDVQNCFVTGGTLPVKDGEQVVPVINKLSAAFENVVVTQDWHTARPHLVRLGASRHEAVLDAPSSPTAPRCSGPTTASRARRTRRC